MASKEELILRDLTHSVKKFGLFVASGKALDPTAADLVDYVKKADWDFIETIWRNNPQLMFTSVKDENGIERSPLEWALYNLDTYTWKPFYEWIQEKKPELVDEFHLQKNALQDHINIEPLFNEAYSTYYAKAEQYIAGKIDEDELDRQWIVLGRVQKKYLPMHMLMEMCRYSKEDTWDPACKFDTKIAPIDSFVRYCSSNNEHIYLDSDEFNAKFGVCFSLDRGKLCFDTVATDTNRSHRSRDDVWPHRLCDIAHDAACFQQLYNVRVADHSMITLPESRQSPSF